MLSPNRLIQAVLRLPLTLILLHFLSCNHLPSALALPLEQQQQPNSPTTAPGTVFAYRPTAIVRSKVNLLIFPLSAALIFIGLIVARCYCWMVEDIREHEQNLDGVFSDESLRDQHQADVERISSVRLARRLKRGWSTEDPVGTDSTSSGNSAELLQLTATTGSGAGVKLKPTSLYGPMRCSSACVKTWLDQVPHKEARNCASQSSFFTYTGGVLFLSPRTPLRTRSFTGLHLIPEDCPLGHSAEAFLPQLENTDSSTLTIASTSDETPPTSDLQSLERDRDT